MAEEQGTNTRPLYGKNPPTEPFKNIIGYLDELIKLGGTTGTFDDLTKAVKSTSVKSSTFDIRTAIMKKFGLLRTEKNDTYTLEPLGTQITSGIEEQRREAIRKAFLNIPIIRRIWETYKGNVVPPVESFGNNLVARLPTEIPNELRDKWAKYFYEGAEFAGFFDKTNNGFYLKSSEPNPEKITTPEIKNRSDNNDSELKTKNSIQTLSPLSNESNNTISKNLSSGRLIAFSAPEEPTQEEAIEIERFLKMQIKRNLGFTKEENGQ